MYTNILEKVHSIKWYLNCNEHISGILILGPVIGVSHINILPKINQNYKQDQNIPNFQKIENIPFKKTWKIFSQMHSQMKTDIRKVKWNES